MISAEVLSQLRALGHANAPSAGAVGMAGKGGAFQLDLPADRDACEFAPAPPKQTLEQQGARFVRLPRALYNELYLLCDAQRRGQLSGADELLLSQLMRSVALQVGRGLS